MTEEELIEKSIFLADIYTKDINGDDLGIEMVDLKKLIHPGNFGENQLNPFELLNKILTYKLGIIGPNDQISVCLFEFFTLFQELWHLLKDHSANSS